MVLNVDFPLWLTTAKVRVFTGLAHMKVLWKIWDLRSFILLSLALQTLLILLAPFRKRTANVVVIVSIWLAYLLADYVAIQAVGLIPNYNSKPGHNPAYAPHGDLLAFWAPFLLVHLGGPDPITALALEDNELWMRTALHLFTYASATGRVFFQSLPTNILSIPTVLMFLVGILKYLERTLSLYNARLTQFKSSMLTEPDAGPNYAKLMESYDSYLKSALPARFDTNPEPDQYNVFAAYTASETKIEESEEEEMEENNPAAAPSKICSWEWLASWFQSRRNKPDKERLSNVKLVRDAYEFFEKYKGLYVDLIFSFHDRNKSRTYFLDPKLTAKNAFTVVEIELNFTYEVFFTKMIVIHQTFGTSIRSISFALEVLSLLIWILFIRKGRFHGFDIWITYVLLVGAIVIDMIAFLMVVISDWQLAMLSKESQTRASLYDKLLSFRERTWGNFWGRQEAPFIPWIRRVLFRRWSESVFQFNLIHYRVDPWSRGMSIFFKCLPPIKDMVEGLKYVSKKWFADELRDFIYRELRYKAEVAEDPKDAEEICESKGDWVLRSLAGLDFEPFVFYRWTVDVEYDECLLLWHIATELLYQAVQDQDKKDTSEGEEGNLRKEEQDQENIDDEEEKKFRNFSKTLSDYMMYLLNRQPLMMFAVAGIGEVRFLDTCAEATIFFDRVLPKRKRDETTEQRIKTACKRMMDVNTDTSPRDIKGDRSKSVLFDAVQLAKELKKVKDEKGKLVGMWELIAKVWVELLSYSATHTRASAHASQLKQGGELLTLIWLMMVHLGLGRQFRITQGNARSKLIISK